MAKKPAQPAAVPPQTGLPTIRLADAFAAAGGRALDDLVDCLAARIDYKKLVDPEWLRDSENRKIAVILVKVAAIQMNAATAIMNGHPKLGDEMRATSEREREGARILEDLERALDARAETSKASVPDGGFGGFTGAPSGKTVR